MEETIGLFKGTAWYYARYRPSYPEAFFSLVKDKFCLTTSDRVLDLGCGTGQIAIPLSRYVREVIAIDPDPEMLNEGKRLAENSRISNIRWLKGRAEDLANCNDLGRLKLATLGCSFHWMNRRKVLASLYDMLEDSGGIVIVGAGSIWTRANEWQLLVKKVIQKWLGEERRAGQGVFTDTEPGQETTIVQSTVKIQ